MYPWELLITYPAVNMAVNLVEGIKHLAKKNNFIGVVSLTRSLIEVTLVFVYECTSEKNIGFYEQFVKNGRLMRWSKNESRWVKIKDWELIGHFESVTGLKVRKTYDNCCNVLHFSKDQSKMLVSKNLKNPRKGLIELGVGVPKVPKEKYDKIIKFAEDCEEIMEKYLKAMIIEKKLRKV